MARARRGYTQALTIAGGDNAEKTIEPRLGVVALDAILVTWGTSPSPDGTLDVYAEWDDESGAIGAASSNPIRVALSASISAGAATQRIAVPTPIPNRIVAKRDSSSAGTVKIALLPSGIV